MRGFVGNSPKIVLEIQLLNKPHGASTTSWQPVIDAKPLNEKDDDACIELSRNEGKIIRRDLSIDNSAYTSAKRRNCSGKTIAPRLSIFDEGGNSPTIFTTMHKWLDQ